MKPQPVKVFKRVGNKDVEGWDELGGVFRPVPGQGKPVYTFGPGPVKQDMVFQCPVSAVPVAVWELLHAWWACRLMKCLPKAGGFLDQPLTVRWAFPIFEAYQQGTESNDRNPEAVAALAVGATLRAMFGGKR